MANNIIVPFTLQNTYCIYIKYNDRTFTENEHLINTYHLVNSDAVSIMYHKQLSLYAGTIDSRMINNVSYSVTITTSGAMEIRKGNNVYTMTPSVNTDDRITFMVIMEDQIGQIFPIYWSTRSSMAWGIHIDIEPSNIAFGLGHRDTSDVQQIDAVFHTWVSDYFKKIITDVDPYSGGGPSTISPKPPTGTYTNVSDPIDFPQPPTLGALSSKFITVYSPTPAELQSFASYLWTGAFNPANFKKLMADPFQALIGLSILPIQPQKEMTPHTLAFGNISTGISMYRCVNHYEIFDCGSINVEEYWGSYLDYDPYTKISIYLPYIGTEQLSADDVMGKTISVKYMIDIITGACVASIKAGNSVLYQYAGSCVSSIPITGNDWNAVISGTIQSLISTAGVIAAGVAGSPVASGAAVGLMASSASNAMEMKTNIKRSGTIAGCSGFLSVQTPYLIITRPRQAVPDKQNTYTGYPSFITQDLSTCSGFTIVDHIHLDNIPATSDEIAEIETLLKSGVIF